MPNKPAHSPIEMKPELLAAKLQVPPPRPHAVPRPHLIARLHLGLTRPVTLISAPAGFGKTTLLSSGLNQLPAPTRVAWITLDAGDDDPARFLAYLFAALGAPRLPALDEVLTPVISRLSESPHSIAIVLDDYHLIEATAIHRRGAVAGIGAVDRVVAAGNAAA